jgi:hypothetical protein
MVKDIAFVGDSFCADYERDRAELAFDAIKMGQPGQGYWAGETCWTTELARRLGYRAAPFGFGGQSWWHSRQMFYQHYWSNPKVDQNQLQAIVFCHTNQDRINRVDGQGLHAHDLSKHESQGLDYYYKNIHDWDFAKWARDQWFVEIGRTFAGIKTVHLFCFDQGPSVVDQWTALPGVRMINPLVWIMVGELIGNKKYIDHTTSHGEYRCNHLSTANNLRLADIVYQAITDYAPGDQVLDLSVFDLPNPNYQQWPNGQYWMD